MPLGFRIIGERRRFQGIQRRGNPGQNLAQQCTGLRRQGGSRKFPDKTAQFRRNASPSGPGRAAARVVMVFNASSDSARRWRSNSACEGIVGSVGAVGPWLRQGCQTASAPVKTSRSKPPAVAPTRRMGCLPRCGVGVSDCVWPAAIGSVVAEGTSQRSAKGFIVPGSAGRPQGSAGSRRDQHLFRGQGLDQFQRRLKPVLRALRHELAQDHSHIRRHFGTQGTDGWHLIHLVPHQLFHHRAAGIRHPARQELEERAAKAVKVGADISEARVSGLFGGDVIRRAHDRTFLRQGPGLLGRVVGGAGQAHVQDLDDLAAQQKIVGLDVAVNQASFVGVL